MTRRTGSVDSGPPFIFYTQNYLTNNYRYQRVYPENIGISAVPLKESDLPGQPGDDAKTQGGRRILGHRIPESNLNLQNRLPDGELEEWWEEELGYQEKFGNREHSGYCSEWVDKLMRRLEEGKSRGRR